MLQELAEFVHEKYLELMKASEAERARGYLKLFKLLIEVLSDKPLIVHSYSDYLTAVDLAVSRGLDVTDALLTVTALRLKGVILTRNKDFERVGDLVKVIYLG